MNQQPSWWTVPVAAVVVALIIVLASLVGGCALAPERVNVELQHTSHVTQHFSSKYDGRHYGYDAAGLDVHWQYKRVGADIFEGAVLGACSFDQVVDHCEALAGPREVFSARVDVALWSKE
jgi:hypothetical protein